MSFRTILCIDGSAGNVGKRPVYCVHPGQSPLITRFQDPRGVLAVLDNSQAQLPRPVLITVDVPIGLPEKYKAVWAGEGSFLNWLDARNNDRRKLVVNSVAEQTPQSPFVMPGKGQKKADGQFPRRECEDKIKGQSVFWLIGGKQVGKAALQFWFETLVPLRSGLRKGIAVWPFEPYDGKAVVVAERYPASLYQRVWRRGVTKSKPSDLVDALYGLYGQREQISPLKTWFHAASSDDEFDMFTGEHYPFLTFFDNPHRDPYKKELDIPPDFP